MSYNIFLSKKLIFIGNDPKFWESSNIRHKYITQFKIYECSMTSENDDILYIRNDNGDFEPIESIKFITKEEFRNTKIDEILDKF